jgi:hypothetical protein
MTSNKGFILSLALSADGTMLYSGSGCTLEAWETSTGAVRSARSAALPPSLPWSNTRTVTLRWCHRSGAIRSALSQWRCQEMVAFCTLVAMTTAPGSGTSRRAKYVATAPGLCDFNVPCAGHTHAQLVRTLRGHSDAVTSLAVSPDGRFVYTAAADKTVKAWEAASGEVS